MGSILPLTLSSFPQESGGNENVRVVRDRGSAVQLYTPRERPLLPPPVLQRCDGPVSSLSDTALSQGEGGQGQTAAL